jgi:hypothetical protein
MPTYQATVKEAAKVIEKVYSFIIEHYEFIVATMKLANLSLLRERHVKTYFFATRK